MQAVWVSEHVDAEEGGWHFALNLTPPCDGDAVGLHHVTHVLAFTLAGW